MRTKHNIGIFSFKIIISHRNKKQCRQEIWRFRHFCCIHSEFQGDEQHPLLHLWFSSYPHHRPRLIFIIISPSLLIPTSLPWEIADVHSAVCCQFKLRNLWFNSGYLWKVVPTSLPGSLFSSPRSRSRSRFLVRPNKQVQLTSYYQQK